MSVLDNAIRNYLEYKYTPVDLYFNDELMYTLSFFCCSLYRKLALNCAEDYGGIDKFTHIFDIGMPIPLHLDLKQKSAKQLDELVSSKVLIPPLATNIKDKQIFTFDINPFHLSLPDGKPFMHDNNLELYTNTVSTADCEIEGLD